MSEHIEIKGARVNNLKNITLSIPRNIFVVVTGLSGSGKSSLVYDTLYAEGHRRFAESLSSYARQFLGKMTKPDVDKISGIPPAVVIKQKVSVNNPRSTVATMTDIYDYLKLVFKNIGKIYSPVSGKEVRCHTTGDVLSYLFTSGAGSAHILADLNWNERKDRIELLLSLQEQGFLRLWNGKPCKIEELLCDPDIDDTKDVFLLVDRIRLRDAGGNKFIGTLCDKDDDFRARLIDSVNTAFEKGNGRVSVACDHEIRSFCNKPVADGIEFAPVTEHMFSFNSPLGACPVCGGLGEVVGISEDLVIPDKNLSIYDGAIACWRGEKMSEMKDLLISKAEEAGIPIFTPYRELSDEVKNLIWNGKPEIGLTGINEFFKWVETKKYKIQYRYMLSRFSGRTICSACKGSRLRPEALYVRVGGKNFHELQSMTVSEVKDFFEKLELSSQEKKIIGKVVSEIMLRIGCLEKVGLGYLSLNRSCKTLSGGENQRVNIVRAVGSGLVGSMYILDEPSIGLHQKDTERLISVIKQLRDMGNTVIVVEHDEEMIRSADLIIDMGKYAGAEGGEVVFYGSPDILDENSRKRKSPEMIREEFKDSLTMQYLSGIRERYCRKTHVSDKFLKLEGVRQNNLKGIDVEFPLGVFTVVCGVSGSGKSSLVSDVLYPAINNYLNKVNIKNGDFENLAGDIGEIYAVEYVDQNPIGRSSRSNPATYLKIYDDVRKLLSEQQYAKLNGFTPSYFSFNQDGGRCPECLGEGMVKISMQFMSDVTLVCDSCGGKRFNREILDVRYAGKNVDDILGMRVDEAMDFFSSRQEPEAARIVSKLKYLEDVGLSYIQLGQSSSTFSGGESQRIKLAYFLAMNEETASKNKMIFIFDEPTTGLHFHDVKKLLKAFDSLIDRGHTVIVVEHNIDVIRMADHVIELGPGAGEKGGNIIFSGKVGDLVKCKVSNTAKYIKI